MARTLVFLSESFPNTLSEFVAQKGYRVLEATSVFEVLALSERYSVDAVIVAAGGEWYGLDDVRHIVRLQIHATGPDIFFELSNLFPTDAVRLQ